MEHEATERAVVVTGAAGDHLRAAVARGLRDEFASVSTVDAGFASQADAVEALRACAPVGAVVHVFGHEEAQGPNPLAAVGPSDWEVRAEQPVRDAMFVLQAAHALFAGDAGGRVLLVLPTFGITGAPGLVPAATAVEGIRALAKSAARQWGRSGITVNCVLVAPGSLSAELEAATSFVTPPALGAPGSPADLVAALAFLAGPGAAGITGATLVVDGGAVMVP